MSKRVLEALAVTAELMGNEMSPAAAQVMYSDLSQYPERLVMDALVRVRREVKGRLCIADVIDRIDDGRPGVEEAWAMMPFDESATVVWTTEMQRAFGVCSGLISQGDLIAARMAFKEAYSKELRLAKSNGSPVEWSASLGHDKQGRESALKDAVAKGRLPISEAKALCHTIDDELPSLDYEEGKAKISALIKSIEN